MPPTTNIPAQDVNLALAAIACPVPGPGHLMPRGHGLRWQAAREQRPSAPARRSHRRHGAPGARQAGHPAMTTDHRARPLPGCPARRGDGADVNVAEFFLVVHDCPCGPAARPSATEVFGFFGLPDPEQENDVVVTASVVMPSGLPAARLAHQVSNDPPGTQRAADVLRRHVTACPCTASAECPALGQARLLAALQHPAGAPAVTPPSRARHPARHRPAPQRHRHPARCG